MITNNMENQRQYTVYSRNSLKYLGLDIQGAVA